MKATSLLRTRAFVYPFRQLPHDKQFSKLAHLHQPPPPSPRTHIWGPFRNRSQPSPPLSPRSSPLCLPPVTHGSFPNVARPARLPTGTAGSVIYDPRPGCLFLLVAIPVASFPSGCCHPRLRQYSASAAPRTPQWSRAVREARGCLAPRVAWGLLINSRDDSPPQTADSTRGWVGLGETGSEERLLALLVDRARHLHAAGGLCSGSRAIQSVSWLFPSQCCESVLLGS